MKTNWYRWQIGWQITQKSSTSYVTMDTKYLRRNIEIMELFERNGFHEWIPVLFLKNCYNDILHQAMTSLLIEKAGRE
ncbi:hypothetical protein [Clostridium sp. D33t1_170424_F3]|uniref:hypothetical protein n=1 Tax=Clostridium sp. D33t1_170424_F3 TaxID=2787099 RepID=UPI0018AADB0F|nr:hypothetical protein [Clostridium sp. D33t1_170424_F3]